jgi:hypothetical protein
MPEARTRIGWPVGDALRPVGGGTISASTSDQRSVAQGRSSASSNVTRRMAHPPARASLIA